MTTTVLRVYLKFNGCYVDMVGDFNIQAIMTTWRMDGYLIKNDGNGAPWSIPWDAWAFCAVITFGEETPMKGAPFNFSAGKPN